MTGSAAAPLVAVAQTKFRLPALGLTDVLRPTLPMEAGSHCILRPETEASLFEPIATIQLRI